MPATHRIEPDGPDLFRLVPIEDTAIPEESALLAQAIAAELERFKGRAGAEGLARIARLRGVAEAGLAAAQPDLDRASAELRLGFRYPFVTPSGAEDIAVQLPRRASREQIDFVMKLQDADRLVKQLHRPRGVPALAVPRWLLGLPGRLVTRLAPPAPGKAAQEQRAGAPSRRLAEDQFQKSRAALIAAGRMALPDGGTDRKPELALAERHVAAVLKEAIAEHGPRVRRETLADLAVAFATLTGFFAVAIVLLYACWGLVVGAAGVADGRPAWRHFSLLSVAVGFLFLGAWLSAAQRLNSGDAGVLDGVFSEPFDSWVRGCVLLGVGLIVVLLLHKEAVVLTLGGGAAAISTARILDSFSAAAICGALLGLGERILPGVLSGQADRFMRQFGAQAPGPSGGMAAGGGGSGKEKGKAGAGPASRPAGGGE